MNMNVPRDHSPLQCPRRRVHVRLIGENNYDDEDSNGDQDDFYETYEQEPEDDEEGWCTE